MITSEAVIIGFGTVFAAAYVARNEMKFRQLDEALIRVAVLEKAQEDHCDQDEMRFSKLEKPGIIKRAIRQ